MLFHHTQVFDAYAQFEESMISAKMEESQESGLTADGEIDLELRMARFELLMDRRPLLLNRLIYYFTSLPTMKKLTYYVSRMVF